MLIVAQSEIRGVSESLAPEYFVYTVLHHLSRRTTLGTTKKKLRTYTDNISGHLEVQIMDFRVLMCSQIMEFDLKWVHMDRYELILKQDGPIWVRIDSKPK